MEQDLETTNKEGFGELAQSRTAVWIAAGILILAHIADVILSVLAGEPFQTDIFGVETNMAIPLAIDVFLIVFLLLGKQWARTWMLVRLVIGLLVFGIFAIIEGDLITLVLQLGLIGSSIILLTGSSTRRRLIIGISCFLLFVGGGIIWATLPPTAVPVEYYTRVSLGGFSVKVPSDWEEVDPAEAGFDEMISQSQGTVSAAMYGDNSRRALVMLMVLDMKQSYELGGLSWGGWEEVEEVEGMSKQDTALMFTSASLVTERNVTMESTRMLTLDNCDACEVLFSAEVEGEPSKANFLFLFGEDHLGCTLMFCQDTVWHIFDECWPVIRDSSLLR